MKTLLVVAASLLLLASDVCAQGQLAPGPPISGSLPDSALLPDIFHVKTHTCVSFAVGCGPDNLVLTTFALYAEFFVPVTQPYTRIFVVSDTEGAVVGAVTGTTTLTPGKWFFSINGTFAPGLYKFMSVVTAPDGRASISERYRFRVN